MSAWNSSLPLSSLEPFTSKEAQALAALEIYTVRDLLDWFPRRYEDRRR
ncbi:MAG: hypothetical protein HRU37_10715, partial [Roseibacillus sp.]|nr:hypothetical protein [Roseibacillus sp.]